MSNKEMADVFDNAALEISSHGGDGLRQKLNR